MTRQFSQYALTQLLLNCDDYQDLDDDGKEVGPLYEFVESDSTGETVYGTDDLGEWNYLIFTCEGVTWRCYYVDGNGYWRANSGERWDDYFQPANSRHAKYDAFPERYTRDGDEVTCQAVIQKETVIYTWETSEGDL